MALAFAEGREALPGGLVSVREGASQATRTGYNTGVLIYHAQGPTHAAAAECFDSQRRPQTVLGARGRLRSLDTKT